ncbi:MAG: 30S ribosomal protein S17 [Promethearchaeota archaeon]
MKLKNIGIPGVAPPLKVCDDPHCPFHGTLPVRGRIFIGKVLKTKMQRSITVRIDYMKFDKKYQRYERRNSKISVHCPPCIEVQPGDIVKFISCRKISKTISTVVIQVVKKEK